MEILYLIIIVAWTWISYFLIKKLLVKLFGKRQYYTDKNGKKIFINKP